MIYYIGDWHYNHANCVAFDARPFKNVTEMNASLIHRWNRVVQPNDTVYVLGDMFWGSEAAAEPVLASLPGKKILIRGNHDKLKNQTFISHFAEIHDYLEIRDGDRHVVLCHYPIPCFKNHFHGWYHLYAHVHDSFEANMMAHDRYLMEELYQRPCKMYNVGAMTPWMDYTPRTLDQIITGYENARR